MAAVLSVTAGAAAAGAPVLAASTPLTGTAVAVSPRINFAATPKLKRTHHTPQYCQYQPTPQHHQRNHAQVDADGLGRRLSHPVCDGQGWRWRGAQGQRRQSRPECRRQQHQQLRRWCLQGQLATVTTLTRCPSSTSLRTSCSPRPPRSPRSPLLASSPRASHTKTLCFFRQTVCVNEHHYGIADTLASPPEPAALATHGVQQYTLMQGLSGSAVLPFTSIVTKAEKNKLERDWSAFLVTRYCRIESNASHGQDSGRPLCAIPARRRHASANRVYTLMSSGVLTSSMRGKNACDPYHNPGITAAGACSDISADRSAIKHGRKLFGFRSAVMSGGASAAFEDARARLNEKDEELTRVYGGIANLKRALGVEPFAPVNKRLSSEGAVKDELKELQAARANVEQLVLVYMQRVMLLEQQQQQDGAGRQQGGAPARGGLEVRAADAQPVRGLLPPVRERMAAAMACVGRIIHQGKHVGTVVRLTEDGLCISAAHVFLKKEKFLQMKAWGQPLKLVASCPGEDVIFLQGRKGTAIDLASSWHVLDRMKLKAVTFPLGPHENYRELARTPPLVMDGFVSAMAPSGRVALGSCSAAVFWRSSASGASLAAASLWHRGKDDRSGMYLQCLVFLCQAYRPSLAAASLRHQGRSSSCKLVMRARHLGFPPHVFRAALPAASGGLVLDQHIRFAGICIGTICHDDRLYKPAENVEMTFPTPRSCAQAHAPPKTIDFPGDGHWTYQSNAREEPALIEDQGCCDRPFQPITVFGVYHKHPVYYTAAGAAEAPDEVCSSV
ncbi:hypothetical protein JKP88DRAFT_249436 [Tribonema minus]|uniref:Uncharacterized protein n=1 Tax=Tribonema minus TaxID=303371 RepID=A0A836C874_9STRA|nr:hypothetical protein JKP88DRAFT_249436 [Tribonema minus]